MQCYSAPVRWWVVAVGLSWCFAANLAQAQEDSLTLRPSKELRPLAERVARVIALRSGREVELGPAPPLEILEAVPAGQLALAQEGRALQLALVGTQGRVYRTRMELTAEVEYPEARAVALAVEALEDLASDAEARPTAEAELREGDEPARPVAVGEGQEGAGTRSRSVKVREARQNPPPLLDPGTARLGARTLGRVLPLLYLRAFTGISPLDQRPTTGFGSGMGLCLRAHCLLLGGDFPLLPAQSDEVRFWHASFHARFYVRPFESRRWSPAASLGLVTHVGTADSAQVEDGRSTATTLGLRGSLELAYRLSSAWELVAEGGLDRAHPARHEPTGAELESRWGPWLWLALRIMP